MKPIWAKESECFLKDLNAEVIWVDFSKETVYVHQWIKSFEKKKEYNFSDLSQKDLKTIHKWANGVL